VKHTLHALQVFIQQQLAAAIALNKIDRSAQGVGLLVTQVIDDPHSMPKRQQVLTQVRTNKVATAGN
jgi:hypothetical protein